MSVRSVETRFNLRTIVEEEAASKPISLTQAPVSGLSNPTTPPAISSKLGLKFDFSDLQRTGAKAATAPKLDLKPAQFATTLKNPFAPNKESNTAEVVRLTLVVDDLATRLKNATVRATMAEGQLEKTQYAMRLECKNLAERIKAANAQLGVAHTTESQLRSDLSKASKAFNATPPAPVETKTQGFESAVVATLEAQDTFEKMKKEMDTLRSRLLAQDVEAKQATLQIHKLRADATHANSNVVDLKHQLSETAKEAAVNYDRVAEELKRATTSLALTVATQALVPMVPMDPVATVATVATEMDVATNAEVEVTTNAEVGVATNAEVEVATNAGVGVATNAEVEVTTNAEVGVEVSGACPNCNSSVSGSFELATDPIAVAVPTATPAPVDVHMENAPSTEVPMSPAIAMDPIKTHARYNRLRERVVVMTANIARLEHNNPDDPLLSVMLEKRLDLYERAKSLKKRYDVVFGAVEPDSVVNLLGTESFVSATPEDAVGAVDSAHTTGDVGGVGSHFAPLGDAPKPCMTHTIPHARNIAQCCPIRGAFDFGSFDSGVAVGKAMVGPITLNHVVVGEDAANDTEMTESHTTDNKMATAIVKDIRDYLAYVVKSNN